ncbi:MAG TPA: NAD(P)-dependent oxidoreductase [Chloroflexota bacterium]|nr:NAD(P)-dependent oxidoreductase [Chloroflexota bacterium]
MPTRVGFIGLGTMGTPMALNALAAGFELTVFDPRKEATEPLAARGAQVATSARELGVMADVIQLAVPDDAAVRAAVLGQDGLLAGAKPGTTVIIHSTIHPQTAKEVDARAATQGVHVLDAQMTGARTGAEARNLLFMVGGDAAVLDRVRPVLEASASHVIHMGPLGMGAVTKAAQQAVTVVNLLAASEGIRLAQKGGVDLDAFFEVLRLSTAQSFVIDNRMGFPPELGGAQRGESRDPRPFYRGLRAVLALAFDLDEPAPAAALAQQTVPWVLGS